MCVICDNGNQPKNDEEQIRESVERVNKNRRLVVKSVPIDSFVTVHFLPGYSKHGDSLIRLVTELQRNYKAPGKVDVYYPSVTEDEILSTSAGPAQSQASTARWNSDRDEPDFEGKDRILLVGSNAFASDMSNPTWHMPVYDKGLVSEGEYVITHEWGHVIDTRPYTEEFSNTMLSHMISGGVVNILGIPTYRFIDALSRYGFENEPEAYAECFAEWSVTNGQTNNFAAKWYAKEYGWPILATGIRYFKRQERKHYDYGSYYDSPKHYHDDDEYSY